MKPHYCHEHEPAVWVRMVKHSRGARALKQKNNYYKEEAMLLLPSLIPRRMLGRDHMIMLREHGKIRIIVVAAHQVCSPM
jgi:hypothetical protein